MAGERFHQHDRGSFFGDFIYHRIVPQDHFLRQLDALVPWPRLTKRLVRLYQGKARQGRPPYHPAVILKMLLVAYLYNLSERQTQVVANDSLSIKWFLGPAVDEPAPDHSSLTRFKNRLVEGGKLEAAEALLAEIISLAQAHGIAFGSIQVMDSVRTQSNPQPSDFRRRKRASRYENLASHSLSRRRLTPLQPHGIITCYPFSTLAPRVLTRSD